MAKPFVPDIPDPSAGRRTFNPEVGERIANLISIGVSQADAARASGIDPQVIKHWLHAAEKLKRGMLADWALKMIAAPAKNVAFHASVVHKAAKEGDAKISMQVLKAKRPDEWGDKQTIEVTVKHAVEVAGEQLVELLMSIAEESLDREAYRAFAAKVSERMSGQPPITPDVLRAPAAH